MEMLADPQARATYPFGLKLEAGVLVFDPRPLIKALVEGVTAGEAAAVCAGRFHATLAEMVRQADFILGIIMEDGRIKRASIEVDKPHALRFADSVSVTVEAER